MKTYQMYDGLSSSPVFSDYENIEAKTGREAVLKLIKIKGYKIKDIKRSGGNDVRFKAEPFYEENGNKYRDGRAVWYAPIY